MRGLLFTLLFTFVSNSVASQIFFNKYLEPIDSLNPNPSDLEVLEEEVLVSALYSGNESGIHRFTLHGAKINDHFYQDFASANKAMLKTSDLIFFWGKNRDQEKGLELLQLDIDFDIEENKGIQSKGVWNFPSTSNVYGDSIVTLSIFRDEGSDLLRGTVHMISKDLEELWSKQLHPESSFVNVFNSLKLSSGNLLVSSQYSSNGVNGTLTIFNKHGTIQRQRDMSEEITSGFAVTIIELSNGDIICGTVVDRLFDWDFQQNEWFVEPVKYYWLSGNNLQEQKDTIYTSHKLERPGGEKLWKGNGDYFFIYGNVWYVDEDQTYGMLKKVDNDGNILWSRRYQHEDFTGSKNFHGIEHIQEMPDGSIYTAGSAKFSPGRNHIWIMHLDENGCLGDNCGEVVITDVVEQESEEISKLAVYPNPASDLLTLDHLDASSNYTYMIIDGSGEKYQQGAVNKSSSDSLDISFLNSGLYFLVISKDGSADSFKYKFVVY